MSADKNEHPETKAPETPLDDATVEAPSTIEPTEQETPDTDDGEIPKEETDQEAPSANFRDVHNSVINNIMGGVAESPHIRFSRRNYRILEKKELEEVLNIGKFRVEPATATESLNILERSKISILTSENSTLKQELAMLLGANLSQADKSLKVCMVDRLPSNNLIDFEKDVFKNKHLNNSVIIFNNAAKWKNSDIDDFLEKLNASTRLEDFITDYFPARNIYLVFTLDKNDVKNYIPLSQSSISLDISPPSRDILLQFIRFNVHKLIEDPEIQMTQRAFLSALPEDWHDQLANQVTLASEVKQLFRHIEWQIKNDINWLPEISALRSFIQSVKNFKGWFLGDLTLDRAAWNFVFSLGLLHCLPKNQFNQIPLIEFELFRDLLEDFLRKKEGLKKESKNWKNIYGESYLFEKCRVVKQFDPETGQCFVSFQDEQYVEEIWEVFFGELSLKLVQILPFLIEQLDNPSLKRTAARVMGRIGELDPPSVLSWMSDWASSKDIANRMHAGYLLQGVLASESLFYKSWCKNYLKKLGASGNFNKVWTAIATYKLIGMHDLPYAIEQIAQIADNYLTKPFEMIEKLLKKKKWRLHQLFVGFNKEELKDLASTYNKIGNLNEKLQRHEEIFHVIRYTISALCLSIDPASVFREWKKWLEKDVKSLKVFTARMLLAKDGVLDQLDRQITFYNEDSGEWEDWHYMVKVLESGEEIQTEIIQFFIAVYQHFNASSPQERLALKNSLIDNLERWAISSLEQDNAKKELKHFFVRLIHHGEDLGKNLLKKIELWNNSSNKDESLKSFAQDILDELKEKEKLLSIQADQSLRNLFD